MDILRKNKVIPVTDESVVTNDAPKSNKKVVVKESVSEEVVFDAPISNPEYAKAADGLIGCVRSYFKDIKGVDATREQIHDACVKVLESRK